MRRLTIGLTAALSLCAPAFAEAPARVVRALAEGASSPPAKIGDVDFLVGHWIGAGIGDACVEEVMKPAAGGQIMGMFRQMTPEGAIRFYEFYTISEKDGSLILRVKHFNPDLTGWEEKNETTDFPLVAVEDATAYFDGLTFARVGENGFASAVNVGDGIARFDLRAAQGGEGCGAAPG